MAEQKKFGKGKFLFLVFSMVLAIVLTIGVQANFDNVRIVSETGSQKGGVQVNCPTGYIVTGGGFADKYYAEDDQDASYPNGNGWYCKEDKSNPESECYAVCLDSSLLSTNIVIKTGNQASGVLASCGSSIVLGGGFGFEGISDDDQDASYPNGNGWYCKDDHSYAGAGCYAVCGDVADDYEMTCETVSVQGSFENGVEVMCSAGTYSTSGGFMDASGNNDDQDYNHPIDGGWYCEEDNSNGDSVCYARCCAFEVKEPECVEDRVFTIWSEWVDTSECVAGWMGQTRIRTEYDSNVCGTFEDVVHTESRNVECEIPCVEDRVFTIWTVWENTTECSINGTLEQTRTRMEADANNCGTFEAITHEETRGINCSTPGCCDDGDCLVDNYSDEYCIGDDVYYDFYDYFCDGEVCSYNVSELLVEECDDYCEDGVCKKEREDGDRGYNSTQFEKFEAVNYYGSQSTLNESSNVIGLGDELDSDFDWFILLPWFIVLLILILFILIIRFV